MLAAEQSREVFWDISVGWRVVFYLVVAISIGVFLNGVSKPLWRYRQSATRDLPPLGELPARTRSAIASAASQISIARRNAVAGWAHRAIFYGWMTLFAGTIIVALDSDVTGPILGWHFLRGNFYLGFKAAVNILGTGLVAGLLVMMWRRAVSAPAKLSYVRPGPSHEGFEPPPRARYRLGDWIFLSCLLLICVTGFLLEGARIAMNQPGYNAAQFGGWIASRAYRELGLNSAELGDLRLGLWWFHGMVAVAFVASIPYTKATHMLQSFASLVLVDRDAKRRLDSIPVARIAQPAGYGALADFKLTHLLQLDACTKCGKCHEACPATATGQPLSPRDVILDLHEVGVDRTAEVSVGGILGQLIGRDGPSLTEPAIVGPQGVQVESIWSCYQCNACVEVCPVGIEQAPIINQLRRRLVEQGDIDGGLQAAFEAIEKDGNSFGINTRRRGLWAKDLDFEIKDARREPVDLLWFVGDYASFEPQAQRTTIAFAQLLHHAGVDFGILYDGERNAGNDVRRAGEEGLYESLSEANIARLDSCEFNRIVTTDPHSLNTLANEYVAAGGRLSVFHHTAVLLELVESGKLAPTRALEARATYHDPCHLGRMNGAYAAPRALIEASGCVLAEMDRNRENSFCCGAGGGRIWIADDPAFERPSENRIHEALALDGIDLFVVACPKDVVMYSDAARVADPEGQLRVVEITELLLDSLGLSHGHDRDASFA